MENQIYTFPGVPALRRLADLKLPRKVASSTILKYFPEQSYNASMVFWTQRDTYGGLAKVRGVNGKPPKVESVGEREFVAKPAYVGEHSDIDEAQLTFQTGLYGNGLTVSLDNIVIQKQELLLTRHVNIMEKMCWDLAANGIFSVYDDNGVLGYKSAYPIQRYISPVPWSDLTNSRPMFDLLQMSLFNRGTGVDFGAPATAYINRVTASYLTMNQNQNDFGGKRGNYGQSIASIPEANTILAANGLPKVEVFDDGWMAEDGVTWTPYIADGRAVVFAGLSNGETHGEFQYTKNANNPDLGARPYDFVRDNVGISVPRAIEVHHGFNGGPAIFYPGAIAAAENLV